MAAQTEAAKTKGLAAKMAAAMGEIGRVQKRGSNQAQGYKYARADDVAEEARKVLANHGIAVFADVLENGVREVEGKNGKIRISTVKVAWTFRDAETGEERTVHTPGEGMDTGDKGIYKAMTGAMKYALMLGFLIPTGDGDPEVENEEDREEAGQRRNGRSADQRAAEIAEFQKKLHDPVARKAAVLKWFVREYGEGGIRTKVQEVLGRTFPKDQDITLMNVSELEKLEAHRGQVETLANPQHVN